MIDINTLHRPGLSAIAAFLALSSTPLIAQIALPADPAAAPPVAATMAAPPAPTTAPVATVQSVPETPRLPDIAATETAAAPATVERAAREPATQRQARIAPAAKPASTGNVAREAAAPAERAGAAPSAPTMNSDAARAGMTADQAMADRTAPAAAAPESSAPVAERQADNGTGPAGWALLGGGLLLVLGGAAFALRRRPARDVENNDYAAVEDGVNSFATVPAAAPAPAMNAAPSSRAPVAQPAMVAPRASASGDHHDVLEAMVAEAPSEANPFRSRRNRLRRAEFLLRTGQAEARQADYGSLAQSQTQGASTRSDRWSEMRFPGEQKARVSWKPVRN